MILPQWSELGQVLNLHYLVNTLLSVLFIVTRGLSFICPYVFFHEEAHCEIDSREREILFFLAVLIVYKGRKAANWIHYLSNVFMFAKVAGFFLFLRADPLLGILYGFLCVLQMLLFPEPAYKGPENVVYFQGSELFEELTKHRQTTWVIEFYASWNPTCRHIAPVFAKLSERFTLSNLRFGKLDLGRWPNEASRFYVNAAASSRQLPTIAVFQDGKEVSRRPVVRDKRAVPFVFSEENCILELNLMNIFNECKEKSSRKGGSKKKD